MTKQEHIERLKDLLDERGKDCEVPEDRQLVLEATLLEEIAQLHESVDKLEGAKDEGTDRLLIEAAEALRLTQEYVGSDLLPNLPGWSHFDSRVAINKALGLPAPKEDG